MTETWESMLSSLEHRESVMATENVHAGWRDRYSTCQGCENAVLKNVGDQDVFYCNKFECCPLYKIIIRKGNACPEKKWTD